MFYYTFSTGSTDQCYRVKYTFLFRWWPLRLVQNIHCLRLSKVRIKSGNLWFYSFIVAFSPASQLQQRASAKLSNFLLNWEPEPKTGKISRLWSKSTYLIMYAHCTVCTHIHAIDLWIIVILCLTNKPEFGAFLFVCVCVCEYIKSAVVFVRHMQPLLLYWMPPETAAAAEMQLANIWNPVFKLHCTDSNVFVFLGGWSRRKTNSFTIPWACQKIED